MSMFSKVLGTAIKAGVGAIPGVGPIVTASGVLDKRGKRPLPVPARPDSVIRRGVGIGYGPLTLGATKESTYYSPNACMTGYHLSKTTGQWVRNRRMNMANGHAVKRAIRRVKGFRKLAARIERTLPHAKCHCKTKGRR